MRASVAPRTHVCCVLPPRRLAERMRVSVVRAAGTKLPGTKPPLTGAGRSARPGSALAVTYSAATTAAPGGAALTTGCAAWRTTRWVQPSSGEPTTTPPRSAAACGERRGAGDGPGKAVLAWPEAERAQQGLEQQQRHMGRSQRAGVAGGPASAPISLHRRSWNGLSPRPSRSIRKRQPCRAGGSGEGGGGPRAPQHVQHAARGQARSAASLNAAVAPPAPGRCTCKRAMDSSLLCKPGSSSKTASLLCDQKIERCDLRISRKDECGTYILLLLNISCDPVEKQTGSVAPKCSFAHQLPGSVPVDSYEKYV